LGSRNAAPVQSNKFLAGSLQGFSARRFTAERLLGTQMLRASKTLQPCKDTRRVALVSINLQFSNGLNFSALSVVFVLAPSSLPCPFANSEHCDDGSSGHSSSSMQRKIFVRLKRLARLATKGSCLLRSTSETLRSGSQSLNPQLQLHYRLWPCFHSHQMR